MRFLHFLTLVFCLSLSFHVFAGIVEVATMTAFNGEVFINEEKAKVGDELAQDAKVEVKGDKSWAIFTYQNGHKFRLKEGEIQMKELNPEKSLVELIRGKIFFTIKKLKKSEKFEVRTKRVALAVRGTKFMVEETDEKFYLCVCEGRVQADNYKRKLMVKKNYDLTYSSGSKFKTYKSNKAMQQMVLDELKDME